MTTLQAPQTPTFVAPGAEGGHRERLRDRINFRLVALLALVSLPFLWVLYTFVAQKVTGGVVNKGDYYQVDLRSLGYSPFDQSNGTINDVPERYRQLDGKRVVLVGEMYDDTSRRET